MFFRKKCCPVQATYQILLRPRVGGPDSDVSTESDRRPATEVSGRIGSGSL